MDLSYVTSHDFNLGKFHWIVLAPPKKRAKQSQFIAVQHIIKYFIFFYSKKILYFLYFYAYILLNRIAIRKAMCAALPERLKE